MGQQVKNLLRAQSKYGLMGSSAKTGKKFFTAHRSSFLIKLSFGIGHPPPIYQMQCICVGEGSRVPNLQMEFNYLDSFKSYGIFSNFVVPVVPASSPSSPCHPCHPHIIPMSSPSSPRYPHIVPIVPVIPVIPVVPIVSVVPTHVVPIVPTSCPLSPRHLEGLQIILNSPDSHPTHPHAPGGWGTPNH